MTTCCLASGAKLSVQNQPIPDGARKLKTALSSAVKPILHELEKAALKIDTNKFVKNARVAVLNGFVDNVFQFVDQPLLPSQRNFAPVEEIGKITKADCIEGDLPQDFPEGVYIRNGSNPIFGGLKSTTSVFGRSEEVWVEGEGMLHALYFKKDATGSWSFSYNNRYVETETYKMESARKKPAFLPAVEGDSLSIIAASFLNTARFGIATKHFSNTNVFEHHGKFFSTAENYLPQEIDLSSLETFADWDLNGAWGRPFTSHPKKAPGTGELVIMGFDGAKKPYCVMGVISADGKELMHKFDLKLDRCCFFHEMGVTEKYNIILDFPLIIDGERLAKGGPLFKYEKEKGARIGVIPRYGDSEFKWFEVEPCVAFHLINCFEDGNEVIVRGCKAEMTIIPGPDWGTADKHEWFSRAFRPMNLNGSVEVDEGMLFASVREWRLNMETGEVKETDLSGTTFSMDFPFMNEAFTGLNHKYGYLQVIDFDASSTCGKSKYGGLSKLYFGEHDSTSNKVKMDIHKFPKNNFCTGSAFVTKPGAVEEDDGWVVAFVHDEDTDQSHVLVIDAKKFEDKPVAKIILPQRVPYGHHGTYFQIPIKH